jgi:hypothetical protein
MLKLSVTQLHRPCLLSDDRPVQILSKIVESLNILGSTEVRENCRLEVLAEVFDFGILVFLKRQSFLPAGGRLIVKETSASGTDKGNA